MKNLVLIFFCISSLSLLGKEVELPYTVVHDKKMDHVDSGYCEIIGVVTQNGEKVPFVYVKTLNKKYSTTTDLDGNFKLIIPEAYTQIYVYDPNHKEILVDRYKYKSGHQVKYSVHLTPSRMYEVEKPVVYLYGEVNQKVKIELDLKGEMAFSYPLYQDSWEITIQDNGMLQCNGQNYPYLFWDAKQKLDFAKTKDKFVGEIIEESNVVTYLETTLSKLGLNSVEKTDFITYWAPKMIEYNSVFIQFVVDENYDEIASVEVEPKPESMRRIYLKFCSASGIESSSLIKPEYASFNRKGLTYVEWGGSELENTLLQDQLSTK